ncbi:HEPN domain-containing protein [Candidatus Hakubella thermalkaliphila]|nr:HEPN domain-containing protein [Candidatus Hakubella thermalkaliphila]
MPKIPRTTRTSLGSEKLYMQKAQNFLEGADILLEHANWEAAATLGVHAVISSCDAITAKFLSCRHSGPTHLEVINLLEQLPMANRSELKTKITQTKEVILMKNKVEYEERPIKKTQAQKIVTQADRIVKWVATHVAQ